ncbi:MAG: enoyl-CoA hydratase-related protein [Nitrospirota bacterium]|nr:enoyl-CoA hydratase-related protein [Nitrospirota bacterium]
MDFPFLRVETENSKAVVTIANPPVNALSAAVLDSITAATKHLAATGVKAIILTGEGKFFCAGADIRELDTLRTAEAGRARMRAAQGQLDELAALPVPVIAAINGCCFGGGNELAMACHLRIAAESAKLGQPEINLGIIPGYGGSQRLSRLVGRTKALEMLLTGNPVKSSEAAHLGLVNQVVPDDELMKAAHSLADVIVSKGREAIAATLEVVRRGMETDLAEGQAIEAELFGKLCETSDKEEGIRAFLEKRKANFS